MRAGGKTGEGRREPSLAGVSCGVKGGVFVRDCKDKPLFQLTAGVPCSRGSVGRRRKLDGHDMLVTRNRVNACLRFVIFLL